MGGVERAGSIARVQLEEVKAIARMWRRYQQILIEKSAILHNAFKNSNDKALYNEALRDRDTEGSALYRGLLVQVHGIFEGFVKNVIGGVLEVKRSEVSTYKDLSEALRKEHIVSTSRALQHIKNGSVQGVKFDFEKTVDNLGLCFTGSNKFVLEKEPFVVLLGNCTSKKIEDVFKWMDMPEPFGDKLGENANLKKWTRETSKRKTAKAAKKSLDEKIEERNDIVHGNITKTISQTEFDETVEFFYALTDGIVELVVSSKQRVDRN